VHLIAYKVDFATDFLFKILCDLNNILVSFNILVSRLGASRTLIANQASVSKETPDSTIDGKTGTWRLLKVFSGISEVKNAP
jgi:hypothetical protein